MRTRREILRYSSMAVAAAAAAAVTAGCRRPSLSLGEWWRPRERARAIPDALPGSPFARRLLGRAGYGPRPGDVERVASMGPDAWIEEQLAPESISDAGTDWTVRRIETVALDPPDVFDYPRSTVLADLRRATIVRAVRSERQLQEAMVEFWTDHFNVYAGKARCAWLKVVDDRDVIRRHALGRFRDLLRASAESPAMLEYLDGGSSVAGSPNENHARELLELHTLGVAGGYTQADVQALARALTGWRLRWLWHRGRAFVDAARHDPSPQRILGRLFAAASDPLSHADARRELEAIVDRLAAHPSTAAFVARKLCRRFVADAPSDALVQRTAAAFSSSGGSIRATMSVLLHSRELAASAPKLKRPFSFAISALRASGSRTDGGLALQTHLAAMSQIPFDWPTPDGFPDGEEPWSAGLLPRWNFALSLARGEIRGSRVDIAADAEPRHAAESVLGRALDAPERKAFCRLPSAREAMALALAHPEFQYC